MQKIIPNLWFNGNAKEAVDFYLSVFPDGKVTATSYYPMEGLADFQKPLAGKVLTINYELHGQLFTAINAGPEFTFSPAISLSINCKDQAEIDYFWEKLSAVPEAEQCGWIQDKYGLSWQIVPENIEELMVNPDGTSNTGAFQALMQMKKIIIAELEQSHQGA
jgi:predicted 3-demethylubiquinone-9 3-methyltransferase (glyoxalase superfamily)